MMPPLYPRRVASHPAGSDIRKLAEIVRELHPGGLGLAQAQLLLEVLVHHVDHPVAETHSRNSELIRMKVNAKFLPSSAMKRVFLFPVMICNTKAIVPTVQTACLAGRRPLGRRTL